MVFRIYVEGQHIYSIVGIMHQTWFDMQLGMCPVNQ